MGQLAANFAEDRQLSAGQEAEAEEDACGYFAKAE